MKKVIEIIKNLKKTPRGRGILFFTFYFFFFLILAIAARLSPNDSTMDGKEDNENVFSFVEYNGDNYKYDYTFYVDSYTAYVKGEKNSDKEWFNYSFGNENRDYYKENFLYYSDGVIVSKPNALLDITDSIDTIIKKSSYDSITNYQSGKKVYRYQISSATINNILGMQDLDVEEKPNEIVISVIDNRVTDIEFILDSYCVATRTCSDSMKLNLKYSDFESVKEIVNDNNN